MANFIFSRNGRVLVDFLSQKQHQDLSGVSIQYKQDDEDSESYVKISNKDIYDVLAEKFELCLEPEKEHFHRQIVQDRSGWITASR